MIVITAVRERGSEGASERGLVGACGRKRQYETPVMTGKEHRQPRAVFLLHAQACANHLPLFFRKKEIEISALI